MIPEPLQDQASLFALDLLEGAERAAFEAELRGNAELGDFVRELREGMAEIARLVPQQDPSPALRDRVLREIALEKQASAQRVSRVGLSQLIPWAIAAALAVYAGWVEFDHARLEREVAGLRSADPLVGACLVVLTPSGPAPSDAKATVVWEPEKQSGMIRVGHLPAAGPGHDYQLWVVAANHADPVNAGIVRVGPDGAAEFRFKPLDRALQVKAFAISLEREGGVPKREGPIILIGNA